MQRGRQAGTTLARRRAAPPRIIDRRKHGARQRRWILAVCVVPLAFCVLIAIGVVLMWHRQMAFFRPPPMGGVPAQDQQACAVDRAPRSGLPG